MQDHNYVSFIGRLTRDPELRMVGEASLTKFSIAVNDRKREGGEWVDDPMFLDVEAWKRLAETIDHYCHKGSKVLVTGKLKLDRWTKDDGTKMQRHSMVAFNVQFLDPPRSQEQDHAPAPTETVPPAGDAGADEPPF